MLFFWHELDSTAEEKRQRVTSEQQTWKWEMWKLLHTYRFLPKTLRFKGISISKRKFRLKDFSTLIIYGFPLLIDKNHLIAIDFYRLTITWCNYARNYTDIILKKGDKS